MLSDGTEMKLKYSHEVALSVMTQYIKPNNRIDPVSIPGKFRIGVWQRLIAHLNGDMPSQRPYNRYPMSDHRGDIQCRKLRHPE